MPLPKPASTRGLYDSSKHSFRDFIAISAQIWAGTSFHFVTVITGSALAGDGLRDA